ncbi:MAG: hypothetical protein Kow00129_13370 [Thermoleophilia bacterium]
MPRKVLELTEENFQSTVLEAGRPVLVEFWAPWCGPCRTMSPIVDELASELAEALLVARLNVDEHRTVATRYDVFSIPALLLFNQGRVVKRIIGALPKRRLLDELREHLPSL